MNSQSTFGEIWYLSGLHRPRLERKDLGRRLEFFLRLLPFTPWIMALLRELREPEMRLLLTLQPTLLEKLRRPYMDQSWRIGDKTRILCSHYRWLQAHFSSDILRSFHAASGCLLAELAPSPDQHYQISLQVDRLYDKEGELVLVLAEAGGSRIATLAFSIDDTNRQLPLLRIAGLQGQREAGKDTFKRVTKACHGLRPLPLLFVAAQICAHAWDMAGVTGISGQQHVYSHRKYRNAHGIQRTYDQLWQELGGEMRSGWYWFSSQPQLRDLTTVPSHKRAMYARRQTMLGTLAADMHFRLSEITMRPLKSLPEPPSLAAEA